MPREPQNLFDHMCYELLNISSCDNFGSHLDFVIVGKKLKQKSYSNYWDKIISFGLNELSDVMYFKVQVGPLAQLVELIMNQAL